jgi:peroxiredoxin Q/BCP
MLWVRVFLETITTVFVALARIVTGRSRSSDVLLQPGDVAPEIALPGSDGRVHRLSESRGKAVVLVWFPRAFTGGCTVQCQALARDDSAWRAYAADLFAISVDTPGHAAAFGRATGLRAPILTDESGETARRYGVSGPGGFPRRWTFYIGPDGRILDVDRSVAPASHGRDIAARLQRLGIPRVR